MRPELGSLLSSLHSQTDAQGFSWRVAYKTENPEAHLGKPTDPHSRYTTAIFGDADRRSGLLTNSGLYDNLLRNIPIAKSSLASARNNIVGLHNGTVATWDQVFTIFNAGQMLLPFMMETKNTDPQTLDHSYLALAEVSTGIITGIQHMFQYPFNKNIQILDQKVSSEHLARMKQVMTDSAGTPMINTLRSRDGGEPTKRACPAPWSMVEGIMDVARLGLQRTAHTDLFTEALGQDPQQWGQFKTYVDEFHRDRLISIFGPRSVAKREQAHI